jgi:hypothetical protein
VSIPKVCITAAEIGLWRFEKGGVALNACAATYSPFASLFGNCANLPAARARNERPITRRVREIRMTEPFANESEPRQEKK